MSIVAPRMFDISSTEMFGWPKRIGLLLIIAVLATRTAHAASPEQPMRLTMEDAVRRALSEGTQARLARSAEERAAIGTREALSGLLPQGDARITRYSQSVNLETFGFTIPGQPPVIGPFNVSEGQLSAAVQLFNLAALRLYQARRTGAQAARYDVERVENDVVASVARLYVLVQRADAQAASRAADVTLFDHLQQVANDELQAGTGTRLDVAQARFQVSRARAALLNAQNDRQTAVLALLNAIGAEEAGDVILADPLPGPAAAPSVDKALAHARDARPELKSLQAHVEEARLALAAARAQYMPRVTAEFEGALGGQKTSDLHWSRHIGASVSVPLFRGQIPANVARARLEAEDALTRLAGTQRDIEQEIRSSVLTLQNAEERVRVAEEGAQVAEEALNIARDRRAAGYGSSVEVDRAEDQYQQAHEAVITARADAALAGVQLRHATGDIAALRPAPAPTLDTANTQQQHPAEGTP